MSRGLVTLGPGILFAARQSDQLVAARANSLADLSGAARAGTPPNVITYNAAIGACEREAAIFRPNGFRYSVAITYTAAIVQLAGQAVGKVTGAP